ncbi:MAG TPA: hypothetical protein VF789_12080 [Thermoanaerobaculia bacterium]
MPKASYAKVLRDWEVLLTKVDANKADLPFVEDYRAQLETELAGAKETIARQTAMQASFQNETRTLEGFLERGNVLAVNIRAGVRARYGNRSAKLLEFGMQPLRNRRRSSSEESKKNKQTEGKEEEDQGAPQTPATTEA